ncbi:unnamed protein product [Durusdinium trenchii]|uniref:Uncharacterized protein n=1 Tax=Durusdinium trenchii TaxID=1381693 RepID=A0ABP0RCU4_9DINO
MFAKGVLRRKNMPGHSEQRGTPVWRRRSVLHDNNLDFSEEQAMRNVSHWKHGGRACVPDVLESASFLRTPCKEVFGPPQAPTHAADAQRRATPVGVGCFLSMCFRTSRRRNPQLPLMAMKVAPIETQALRLQLHY